MSRQRATLYRPSRRDSELRGVELVVHAALFAALWLLAGMALAF